jgi:hypothetical protein
MSSSNPVLSGQCQCGRVRYLLNGAPMTFYACHCLDCQSQSASAFGLSLLIDRTNFELLSGQLKTWSTRADDGSVKNCVFCTDCGTRIYHGSDNTEGPISIKAGSLDSIAKLQPVAHIWTRRAHAWLGLIDSGITCYETQPANMRELYGFWSDNNAERG